MQKASELKKSMQDNYENDWLKAQQKSKTEAKQLLEDIKSKDAPSKAIFMIILENDIIADLDKLEKDFTDFLDVKN